MGFSFVIILHLVAIFLISAFIALVGIILTRFLTKEKKRKRKIIFAGVVPFVGLYILYFLGLFGTIAISEIKEVDIGIGDSWYVPINDNCKLLFVDMPEQSYLVDYDKTLIEGIQLIEQAKGMILGKAYGNRYFTYNLLTKEFKRYKNEGDFLMENNNRQPNFKKAIDFYIDRRNEIAGVGLIVVSVVAFLITTCILLIIWKLLSLNYEI